MGNVLPIQDYDVASSPHTYFLIDTCVLIDIFLPDPQRPERTKAHQNFFSDLITENKTLLFSSYQMMELETLFISTNFKYFKKSHTGQTLHGKAVGNMSIKDFRLTAEFKTTVSDFFLYVRQDLEPYSYFVPDIFDFSKQQEYMSHLLTLDFHDMLYCYLGEKYNAPIITYDRDFMSTPFDLNVISLLTPHDIIT